MLLSQVVQFVVLISLESSEANATLLLETEEVKQTIRQLNHKVRSSTKVTLNSHDDHLGVLPMSSSLLTLVSNVVLTGLNIK